MDIVQMERELAAKLRAIKLIASDIKHLRGSYTAEGPEQEVFTRILRFLEIITNIYRGH